MKPAKSCGIQQLKISPHDRAPVQEKSVSRLFRFREDLFMNHHVKTKLNPVTADRKYVYPGCSVLILLCLSLLHTKPAAPIGIIQADSAVSVIIRVIFWAFLALSAVALAVKLIRGDDYGKSFIRSQTCIKLTSWLAFAVMICSFLVLVDRLLLRFIWLIRQCRQMESNPQEFLPSMIYMTQKGGGMLATGIWTTVRIALLGTAIAFVLSLLMVFCRIQEPARRDKDHVRLLKKVANCFARFYIFVIRGTPMMVQALIFYYFGFNLFKKTGMTVTEINNIWSFFISGLCTVSLNSTAYLAEVLRGGIEAIDAGQKEAARSLGMTNWQTMTKIIFPQAIKNSIPAIGNEFIINIKDSSVLSVIGVMDLMYATKSVSGIYYRSLEIYCVAAVVYLLLTWLASLLLKYIGNKLGTQYKGIPSSN